MLFNFPSKKIIVLLVVSTYIIYLGFTSQLSLYIHPRYVVFTFVFSVIGLIFTFIDGYYSGIDKSKTEHKDHKPESKLVYIPLIALVVVAVILPARSLTSATLSQRTTDAGSIVTTTESRPIATLFSESSKGLSIGDWSRIIENNKDPSFYAKKPAIVSGFLYDSGLGDNTVLLARFVVTCCAVDAIPVTVPVDIQNWQETFNEDDWVEVEGTFRLADTNVGSELVLIPESTKLIDQPSNPYAN